MQALSDILLSSTSAFARSPATIEGRILAIATSQTYTVQEAGFYKIYAWGGGGSGAFAHAESGAGASGRSAASGGGGGALVVKKVFLNVGDQLVIVIGAGGAAIDQTVGSTSTFPGNAGGTTTVDGPGVDIDAGGGAGGDTATSTTASSSGATGADGGTATGGDININGHPSDTVLATASNYTWGAGAGAPGLIGALAPRSKATVTPNTQSSFQNQNPAEFPPSRAYLTSGFDAIFVNSTEDYKLFNPTFPMHILKPANTWSGSISLGHSGQADGGSYGAAPGSNVIRSSARAGGSFGAGGGSVAIGSVTSTPTFRGISGAGAAGVVLLEFLG